MEHSGYYLWESLTFISILSMATGMLVLRRKAGGRPAFSDQDRQLFFGRAEVRVSKPRLYIHFGIAVLLCYLAGFLEYLLFASFGASILAAAQLVTLLAIVKKWLC
ncbi:MAG: hypothetical protein WCH75_28170 [Candidatus Binatia bacterium]